MLLFISQVSKGTCTIEKAFASVSLGHWLLTYVTGYCRSFVRFGAVFESAGDEDDERVLGELASRLAKADLKF